MGDKPATQLSILLKKITEINADVIVNAAYFNLEPGEGVDEAIRGAGGPLLEAEIDQLRQTANGELLESGVVRTAPHDFKNCKEFLLHVVGPQPPQSKRLHTRLHEQQLRLAYLNILKICSAERIESVAIPFLSIGTARYPMKEGVQVALQTIFGYFEAFEAPSVLRDISFVTTDKDVFDFARKLLDLKSDDDVVSLNPSRCPYLRALIENSVTGHQKQTMPLNDSFKVASFVKTWGSGKIRRAVQQMTWSEAVLEQKREQMKRNNRRYREMYPERYQATVEEKREQRKRERRKVLAERRRAEKIMGTREEMEAEERRCDGPASDDEMYLLIKCKSKEQYDAVQEELKRRKTAVFPLGVAAGPDDLIWKLGTQKPFVPLKDQKQPAVEEEEEPEVVECSPENTYYPYVAPALPGPSDVPGPSGSFYHYATPPTPDVDQGEVELEDELCVKEEPMNLLSYLAGCAPASSNQFSDDLGTSENGYLDLPSTADGGVSAHLLMSLDDGDEDEAMEEVAQEEGVAYSAELEQQLNDEIKIEDDDVIFYDEVPQKARGLVTKPTSRTTTEQCVKEGCQETVNFKSSEEWSVKCHHVFSHHPDLQYECPLCGYTNQTRQVVFRHLKLTHNQGFTPLYHPVCKRQVDVPRMRTMILECFPGTLVAAIDIFDRSSYQPSVRAVMHYYVVFPRVKPAEQPKRQTRNRCTNCKAIISKGPLEFRLKCEHALTHSRIPWLNCSHCNDKFCSKEDFIVHAKRHGYGNLVRPYSRRLEELSSFEMETVEKLAEKLFPTDPSEAAVAPPAPASHIFTSRLIPLSEFEQQKAEAAVENSMLDGLLAAENARNQPQPAKRGRKRKNFA